MPNTAPKHHFVLQRPGAVYRFQAPRTPSSAMAGTYAVQVQAQLRSRIAELEATLADRTAQLKLAFEEAGTDSLTGLKNRRGWEERLREAVTNWQRYGHKAAVLVMDLDGFKAINDTHGHAAGDAILQHVAGVLALYTRQTDVVARLGGDEFAVLLREADTGVAILKTRALRVALQNSPLLWAGQELRVGVSIGLATVAEAPETHAVMHAADTRMYAFKRVAKAS